MRRVCSIEGCNRPHSCRGWCKLHYDRWSRHGDPLRCIAPSERRTRTAEERFWSKVDKTDDCWLWTGRLNQSGYGTFAVKKHRWVPAAAHRISYEWAIGPIPEGLQLDHLCRVRRCVNPNHLEPVTCRENLLRGETFAAANASKTHCVNGHEFTPDNTYTTGAGYRLCRTCRRLAARAYRARKRGSA